MRHLTTLGLILCVLAACSGPELEPAPEHTTSEGAMAWSPEDDPSGFQDGNLELKLDALPRSGSAEHAPWVGNYWPTWQDNINHRWAGPESVSPAAKYGQAFGVEGVEDTISRLYGVDANLDRKACTEDAQCDKTLGESCAKRTGQSEGRCIPTWWGICHAWAPAAAIYREPQRPVTIEGVTFEINDIKALLTLAHDEVVTRFVSKRCDADEARGQINYDDLGRPSEESGCIDTNPGTLHLLLANRMGRRGLSFVEDRTFDDEVWNQPLRAYRVTHMAPVSAAEANGLVGVAPEGGTTIVESFDVKKGAWKHLDPVSVTPGQALDVVLSGTSDGDLYVRFGSRATTRSYDCRPYDEGSAEACTLTVPEGATQAFISARGYRASHLVLRAHLGGALPEAYRFNPQAHAFHQVSLELDYIGESPASLDGVLASRLDEFTHTDRYDYVLETDASGQIIGGEWVGASKRHHPDFVWVPVGPELSAPIAEGALEFDKIMQIYEASINEVVAEAQTTRHTFEIEGGDDKAFGPFETEHGTPFVVSMTGTGDADLYVRRGAAPTDERFDCRPYQDGSAERCWMPGGEKFHIVVRGYAAHSEVTLEIEHTTPGQPSQNTAEGLDIQSQVASGEWSFHKLTVKAGQTLVLTTTAPHDIDLYVAKGANPTTATHEASSTTWTGNESIRISPEADVVLHIGVYGYEASTFRLVGEIEE